jgi:predicted HicB family RNase H-like nuclease
MSGRVTKCVKIDPDLWREAKLEAVKNDIELSTLIENAVKDYLKKK